MESILNHFDNSPTFATISMSIPKICIGKDIVVRYDYSYGDYSVSIQPKKYFGTSKNIRTFNHTFRMKLIGIDSNLIFLYKTDDYTTQIIEVDMDTYEILSEKKFANKEHTEYNYNVTNGMVYWLNSTDKNQYLYKIADSKVYKIRNPIPDNSIITDIITYGRSECDAVGITPPKKSKFIVKRFKNCNVIYNASTKKYIAYAEYDSGNIHKINNMLVVVYADETYKIIDLHKYSDITAAQLAVDTSAIIKDELAEAFWW